MRCVIAWLIVNGCLFFCLSRLIESDSKSLNSLSTQSVGSAPGAGHSRKSSDTSQVRLSSDSLVLCRRAPSTCPPSLLLFQLLSFSPCFSTSFSFSPYQCYSCIFVSYLLSAISTLVPFLYSSFPIAYFLFPSLLPPPPPSPLTHLSHFSFTSPLPCTFLFLICVW